MSYITVTGTDGVVRGVSEARPTFPSIGAWHVDLFVDSASGLAGGVSIDLGGALTLRGTVLVGGVYVEALHLRVIAGAAGWGAPCTPKFYRGATLGTILADVLAQGAETLAASSDAAARAVVLPAFPMSSASVGANVRALMDSAPAGTSWRFLPDGTFWIGPETWPAFTGDYQVISEEPRERRLDVGLEAPALVAGQSVSAAAGAVHVNRVESSVSAKSIRARAWWQA